MVIKNNPNCVYYEGFTDVPGDCLHKGRENTFFGNRPSCNDSFFNKCKIKKSCMRFVYRKDLLQEKDGFYTVNTKCDKCGCLDAYYIEYGKALDSITCKKCGFNKLRANDLENLVVLGVDPNEPEIQKNMYKEDSTNSRWAKLLKKLKEDFYDYE